MGKTRQSANLVSSDSIFTDITNGRIGIKTTTPGTTLDVSGNITCTDINSASDINLKTNIKPVENSIEKLLQLNGVEFDWKESEKSSIGVIAQDVEKVFPSLVTDIEKHKTVNYNGLIAVLIEAVKSQQLQITSLQAELKNLSDKIN